MYSSFKKSSRAATLERQSPPATQAVPPSIIQSPPSSSNIDDDDEGEVGDDIAWTEESLKKMKNVELQNILKDLGLKKSGKKAELIDRILGREAVAEKKKKPKWKNSKARAMLVRMLMDKQSNVHKMTSKEIQASHKWFQEYDPTSFNRYVRDLRKVSTKKVAVVVEDNDIIKRELNRFPRPSKTIRGEPFWDNHPAKLLLREDVKAGKHLEMKPKLLRQTRSEYKEFSLETFRAHVYQEKRHQKELPMRISRRNKKAQYKYDPKRLERI